MTPHPLRQPAAGLRHGFPALFWLATACAAAEAAERFTRLAVAADRRADAHERKLYRELTP